MPKFTGSYRKHGNSRKTPISASLTMRKPWTLYPANCGKFLKTWEYQTILPVFSETCIWVKKQQSQSYMEQLTGSKLGKEYNKAVYCHSVYLTYMQSTSCEMPRWMNHKLESGLLGEISTTSGMQMTPPLW